MSEKMTKKMFCRLCGKELNPLKAKLQFYSKKLDRLVLINKCDCNRENTHTLIMSAHVETEEENKLWFQRLINGESDDER